MNERDELAEWINNEATAARTRISSLPESCQPFWFRSKVGRGDTGRDELPSGTVARIHVEYGSTAEFPTAEKVRGGWQTGVHHYPDEQVVKVMGIYTLKPRTVTTAAELDALPEGSIVRDRSGLALQRSILGWNCINGVRDIRREELERDAFPATVLHEPTP